MDWVEKQFYSETDHLVLGFHTVRPRHTLINVVCSLLAYVDRDGAEQC